jgi:hypothetical protein
MLTASERLCLEKAKHLGEELSNLGCLRFSRSQQSNVTTHVHPLRGRITSCEYPGIRIQIQDSGFLSGFMIPEAVPKLCEVTEVTDQGNRRVVPERERISRCVGVTMGMAEEATSRVYNVLVESDLLPEVGLIYEGTLLQSCHGGWCYRSSWSTAEVVGGARVALVQLHLFVNADSGAVYQCRVVDWRPSQVGIISYDEAISIATHDLDLDRRCTLDTGVLVERFDEEGRSRRYWVVNPRCDGLTARPVYVDAMEGRIASTEEYRSAELPTSRSQAREANGRH